MLIQNLCQQIPKKLGQGHVHRCLASPLLLTTLNRRLGTEETSFSSSEIGMVLGLLCRTFLFMMRQMFSIGERSGLQTGHFSTRIPFSYAAMMLWLMENVVWHYLVEKCRVVPERDDVWMGAYVVLEPEYIFLHWWCLSRHASCPCHTHSCNPIPSCRLLNWALITTWVVLVLFGPDDMASHISKMNFESWLVWPQNSLPFCHTPF